MKLASVYNELHFKEVTKMPPPATTHVATWLWTGKVVNCKLQLLLTLTPPAGSRLRHVTCEVQFIGGYL